MFGRMSGVYQRLMGMRFVLSRRVGVRVVVVLRCCRMLVGSMIVRGILQSPYTRVPIWRGSIDNIVGVVHAKDMLRALNDAGNDPARIDILKVATRPWFVPDTTSLQDQLNAFLRRKSHFAIVVDEYGEVEGMVTLEDIIEEIVGEIADEHDIDVQGVRQEADGSVVVVSAASVSAASVAPGCQTGPENAPRKPLVILTWASAVMPVPSGRTVNTPSASASVSSLPPGDQVGATEDMATSRAPVPSAAATQTEYLPTSSLTRT